MFVKSSFAKTLTKKLFKTSDFSLSEVVLLPSNLVSSLIPTLVFSLLLAYLRKVLKTLFLLIFQSLLVLLGSPILLDYLINMNFDLKIS